MEQIDIVALVVAIPVVVLTIGFAVFVAEPESRDPDRIERGDLGSALAVSTPAQWVLVVGFSILFLITGLHLTTGISSVAVVEQVVGRFEAWGYGEGFRQFVGWSQIVAAILLIVPHTGSWAAGYLGVLMAGSIYTHLGYGEPVLALVPLVFLAGLTYLAVDRWPRAIGGRTHWRRRAEARS